MLCQVNDLIRSQLIYLDRFAGNELEDVDEFLLALAHAKKLVEGQILFQLVSEAITLRFLHKRASLIAAKLEDTLRCKRILRCVYHGKLRLVELSRGEEVDLERLDKPVDDEGANTCVAGARTEHEWTLWVQSDSINI